MRITSKDETDILSKRVEKLERKIQILEKNRIKKKTKKVKKS